MRNKYVYRSRISESKFREMVRYFALDFEAVKIAQLTGISRISVNKYLKAIRESIARYHETESSFVRKIEIDEYYFSARRVKRHQGNTKVFGTLKPSYGSTTPMQLLSKPIYEIPIEIIQDKVIPTKSTYSNIRSPYNGSRNGDYSKHYQIKYSKSKPVQEHINGVESFFWDYARERLSKFKGIHRHMFYLHLKESEFRFNHKKEDLYPKLLELIRKNPLRLS